MDVMLPSREFACNTFQGCQLVGKNCPSRCRMGLQVVTVTIKCIHADIPTPIENVKWVSYADDIIVYASEVKIPEFENPIKNYLRNMSAFLQDNLLLISAYKSTFTLFKTDPRKPIIVRGSLVLTLNFHLPAFQGYSESTWTPQLPSIYTASTLAQVSARESTTLRA